MSLSDAQFRELLGAVTSKGDADAAATRELLARLVASQEKAEAHAATTERRAADQDTQVAERLRSAEEQNRAEAEERGLPLDRRFRMFVELAEGLGRARVDFTSRCVRQTKATGRSGTWKIFNSFDIVAPEAHQLLRNYLMGLVEPVIAQARRQGAKRREAEIIEDVEGWRVGPNQGGLLELYRQSVYLPVGRLAGQIVEDLIESGRISEVLEAEPAAEAAAE